MQHFLHFIFFLVSFNIQSITNEISDLSSRSSLRHDIVHPIKTCLDVSCQYVHLSLSSSTGRAYNIELVRNDELLADDYFEQIDDEKPMRPFDGRSAMDEESNCYYQSRDDDIKAAVTLCDDKVEGIFTLKNESFIIQYDHELYDHCIFRYHDLPHADSIGDSMADLSVVKKYADKYLTRPLDGRKMIDDPVPEAKYLEILIIVDKALFEGRMNSSLTATRRLVRKVINDVAVSYRRREINDPMNFHIILKGLIIWSKKDPLTGNPNSMFHLIDFLKYNFEHIYPVVGQDHVVLITGRTFPDTPGILGLALKSTICMRPELAAVMAVFSDIEHTKEALAETIAHETGHSLGFSDEQYRTDWNCQGAQNYQQCLGGCRTDDCIMRSCNNPKRIKTSNKWSQCTISTADWRWKKGRYYCLGNRPFHREKATEVISICGNGVIEYGEKCDCSMDDLSCQNYCCHMSNCTLRQGKQCSSGKCCKNCQIQPKGEKCREKLDETCDLEDTCDGSSEFCEDIYVANKTSCGKGDNEWCRMGRCTLKCFKDCFGHGNCQKSGDGHECSCTGLYYGKYCQFRFGITWHIVLGVVFGGIACVITSIVFAIQDRYFIKDQVY